MNKVKLFCFPFAGGSASMYHQWQRRLGAHVELVPMEYTGRGARIREPLYHSMEHAVEDMFMIWRRQVTDAPYTFFGHSLGAMVIFELASLIKRANLRQPCHIFFSGRPAPSCPRRDPKQRHRLPDEEFKAELLELGGTSNEVFQHPELLEMMFPILRNDFRIAEQYGARNDTELLDSHFTVLLGEEEDVLPEEARAWAFHTSKRCDIRYFKGGHFFIQNQTEPIVHLINETLSPLVRWTQSGHPEHHQSEMRFA